MSDKYKFVTNCDIPEPPEAPIVVPDDFPINPLISLPPNPTIPLELIAKFLPCKYPSRFPCPEITFENANSGSGSGSSNEERPSVTYNCENKSELTIDFDVETYCCDVVEDKDGNEVNRDKIILTSHSELTLPYPPTIASGLLYYFDYTEVAAYIEEYNEIHENKLSACERCWTTDHLEDLIERGGDPYKFIWYVFTYDDTQHDPSDVQYLYPLVDYRGRYYTLDYSFKYGERVIASLDHCTCKARLLSQYTECVAVTGTVKGTCSCSYANVTGPGDVELPMSPSLSPGEYNWGVEPDYPVEVNAPFTGYLSKRDNLVYANVPKEEAKEYTGQGTYNGDDYVINITWRQNTSEYDPIYENLPTYVEIDDYDVSGEVPVGAKITVKHTTETCGEPAKNVATDAEYKRVMPAAAVTSATELDQTIQVNLYSGYDTPGQVVTAYNYAGNVQRGDRGMASYSDGEYHFFKRGPEDEPAGPVIHKGLRKHFSGLNGFGVAVSQNSSIIDSAEVSTLTEYEQKLLVLGSRFSTVENISEEGTAEIDILPVDYTSDKSSYWMQKSIDGDPFNWDVEYVKEGAEHVICKNFSNVEKDVTRPETEKKQELKIYGQPDGPDADSDPDYRTVSDVKSDGYIFNGEPLYGPYNTTKYVWHDGSNYKYGELGVSCGAADAEVDDMDLTGQSVSHGKCTYRAYDSNHVEKLTFRYNPIVDGYETTSTVLKDSYEVKSSGQNPGLYKRDVPARCYEVDGSYLKNKNTLKDSASVTLSDLLHEGNYRTRQNRVSPYEYRIYPGTLVLKGHLTKSPDKVSGDETYYYVAQQDAKLEENVTFTFTFNNLQDKTYTPLDIFCYNTNGWYTKKKIETYNNTKVVIDRYSKGIKPFRSGPQRVKEMFYYWEPDVDISSATYTFKEYFKPDNIFLENGKTKTISLTGDWYPVIYDEDLDNYILRPGNSDTVCYALYSQEGNIDLDQTITFTFTKVQNLDVIVPIATTVDNIKTIRWQSNYIRTEPSTPYYWTCPNKTITCDVMPQLPDLTIETDTTTGSFTGYYWKVVNNS